MDDNKMISSLFSDKLLKLMEELLNEFVANDYGENKIYEELELMNESIRLGLYILSMEEDHLVISQRINNVNKKLNEIRKIKFQEAYGKRETDKFLATLGKGDKMSLMNDLGVNVPLEERQYLSNLELEYYRILSDSIKESQEYDERDGIDSFITYKDEEKAE